MTARHPLGASRDLTSELIVDPPALMDRLVECFGLDVLAKLAAADEMIWNESGHGVVMVVYSGAAPRDVKVEISLHR